MDEEMHRRKSSEPPGGTWLDLDSPAFRERLESAVRAVRNRAWQDVFGQVKGPSLKYAERQYRLAPEVADEMFQRALEKALRALCRGDKPYNFREWFDTILENCCNDHVAKNKRTPPLVSLDAEFETLQSRDPTPDDQLLWSQEGERVIRAHERIQREIPWYAKVIDAMVAGEDYKTIPELQFDADGKPRLPNAVRQWIFKIRGVYRKYMAEDDGGAAEPGS